MGRFDGYRRWHAVAVLFAAGLMVFGALHWWRPYVELRRLPLTSSPGLQPLFGRADVTLNARRRLCIAPVALDTDTDLAQFEVTSPKRPQPLLVRATGPGYRSSAIVRDYPADTLTPVFGTLTPPRRDIVGTVCITNRGRAAIALLGTNEPRSLTTPNPTVGGRTLTNQDVTLDLYSSHPQSIASRLGTILHRASAFTGDLAPVWLLWPIAVLVMIGIPAAIVAGFAASLREERR